MTTSSGAVRWAIGIAFVMATLGIVFALLGSIVLMPIALIPLCAGIGIIRKRVWSARGFAIYESAQTLLALVTLAHSNSPSRAMLLGSALVSSLLAVLFFRAAQNLARAGAVQGWASPWITVALLTTAPLLFARPFIVSTGAMENTLLVGDRVLAKGVSNPAPERDAIIVFNYPVDRRQQFIKRIAGIPGDRIRISHKILYRNGSPLNESYAVHKSNYEDTYGDNFPPQPNTNVFPPAQEMLSHDVLGGEIVLPPGKYFVLGDNRDQSLDSRYWGFVDAADIIGKPFLIYDSHDDSTGHNPHPQLFAHHNTRWNRIFKLL
jgi:signal peptidase I